MKKISFILMFVSIAILLLKCKKDNLQIEDGLYKGKFIVTYSSGIQSNQTTLELKNGKFFCNGNSNRIPAGGSGTFTADKSKITFNDENYWTADFDWNLILNGQYSYTFDGKQLIISATKNNVGYYIYNLEKQ